MKTKDFLAIIGAIVILVTGCTLSDSLNTTDELGWKRISMPSSLKGTWYFHGYKTIELTSKKAIADSREWNIETVGRKDDEYRVIVKSQLQYQALYFRNTTKESVEISYGEIWYTIYDAKTADRGEWRELTKE